MEGGGGVEEGIPARLTVREGREFGCTVGAAFLLLGGWAWWRGHTITSGMSLAAGFLLLIAGLAVPSLLGPVRRAWMALAGAISRVTTPMFMGIVYYGLFTPVGLAMRIFGKDPLGRKKGPGSLWVPRNEGIGRRPQDMERQF